MKSTSPTWQNWSGVVQSHPRQIVYPAHLQDIIQLVKRATTAGRTLRVVGAGHAFTPVAQTDDILLSLDNYQGLKAVNYSQSMVEVLAGTRLKHLNQLLDEHGLALENMGDIDAQSLAGAISTGTHGTGLDFGSLATQITRLQLVTASGQVLNCSPEEDANLFHAACVSLGMLGIVTRIRLRVQPAYNLHQISHRAGFADCLANIDQYKTQNRQFEFFWFPHTDAIQIKLLNETKTLAQPAGLADFLNTYLLENGGLWLLSEISRAVPRTSPYVAQVCGYAIGEVNRIDKSYRIFATPRFVRFHEMEYYIPAERVSDCLKEIDTCIRHQKFAVHFPIEVRFVKGDNLWLSPAYQRDSATIAVHMYRGMPYKAYFAAMEAIFRQFKGRPHWGKMHTLTPPEVHTLYSHAADFLDLRAKLDPTGLFLNTHLRAVFGV